MILFKKNVNNSIEEWSCILGMFGLIFITCKNAIKVVTYCFLIQ